MGKRRDERLRSSEHKSKERILTQSEPAKIRRNDDAVVLKDRDIFMLADPTGDIPFELPHGYGLFYRDCRHLDGLTLTVSGRRPTLLSAIGIRGFEAHHHLANPEIGKNGRKGVPRNTVGITRRRVLQGNLVRETQIVHNYGRHAVELAIELRFRARFEDVFVVKGFVQRPRGRLQPVEVRDEGSVRLAYDGKDGCLRTTAIAFVPPPTRLDRERAVYHVALGPDERREIAVTFTPTQEGAPDPDDGPADPATPPATLRHWHERAEDIWLGASTTIETSNRVVDRVLRQALLDLRTLRSRLEGLDYFAAGVPWFVTLFGRDASIVGLQTLPYGWATARHTLRLLARLQARKHDPYRDAEPGKILHEYRGGELARLDAIPQSPAYYGAVDATMLFLILLTEYVRWSGDLELARELRPNVDAALDWLDGPADSDGDGYLDYRGRYGTGLVNQGWKDSGNAIVNEDGSFAEPPIALCEVQAYAYRAWRQVAWLLRALRAPGSERLEDRAEELRGRFERDFWDEGLGCYVLALQAGGRPARVASSNAGHVLWGGIASPSRAAAVVERLMAPDMFSGWGVRTLSREAAAYNPMSYHLGSVWPHDNAIIVSGFRRYGHDVQAVRVFDALFDAAVNLRGHRLPELFCGHDRRVSEERPISYPVACSPQAWASGALPHALWNLLGLRADALRGRLTVQRPRLPQALAWLEVHGLAVGAARVDLRFERGADEAVRVDAKVGEGDLEVERVDEIREEMA